MKDPRIRINKFLAHCGLGSRRKVEELVLAGRVRVNGVATRDLSKQIAPESDSVEVDGRRIKPVARLHYLMLNKPKGYITSREDIENRRTVMDLIPERYIRDGIFPVGRLDKDTEGLLMLTNDGDLAFTLLHPRFEVQKIYLVELNRPLEERDRLRIEKGIFLYGKKTGRSEIAVIGAGGAHLSMTIAEGKKRQVRLSFTQCGYRVMRLRRIAIGPLKLTGLDSGSFRTLSAREVKMLKSLAVSRLQSPHKRKFS